MLEFNVRFFKSNTGQKFRHLDLLRLAVFFSSAVSLYALIPFIAYILDPEISVRVIQARRQTVPVDRR